MFHFVAEQIGKEFEDCGAFLPVNVNVDKKVIEKVANDLIETGLLAGVTKVGRFSWDGFHAVEKPYGLVTKGYVHGNLNWGYVWDNVTMNKIACLSKLGKYEEATELLDMVFTVVNAMPEDERIANELALLLVAVSNVYGNESKNPGMSRVLGVFFRVRPETLAAFITLLKQGNDAPNA
jgi:hypothetical protein